MSFCNFKDTKSDDDDDFIFDDSNSDYEFRTNSSSSSLKWSQDARKQNEEDWLNIEKILYREEALPEGNIFQEFEQFHRRILSIFSPQHKSFVVFMFLFCFLYFFCSQKLKKKKFFQMRRREKSLLVGWIDFLT